VQPTPAIDAPSPAARPARTAPRDPAPAGRASRRLVGGAWFAASVLLLLVAWEVASRLELLNPLFFSRPTEIIEAAIREVQLGRFWRDVGTSALAFTVGFGIAAAAAVPLGLAIGMNRKARHIAGPWVEMLNSTPRVALLPLVVIWVGLGIKAAIVVVFLGAAVSILISTIDGVKTIDPSYLRLAQSFRASSRLRFKSVVFPATIPSIVAGLRIGVERALIGVFVAELFGGNAGVGFMIKRAGENLQADRVFFGVLVFIVFGLLAVAAVSRLERHYQHWRPVRQTEAGNG
jgi:ABC-type nitrate/sulfonate/bicarbonate transport system permease component